MEIRIIEVLLYYPHHVTVSSLPSDRVITTPTIWLTVSSLPPPSDCVITTPSLWLCYHYPHHLTVSSLPVITTSTLDYVITTPTLWLCHYYITIVFVPPSDCVIITHPLIVTSLSHPLRCHHYLYPLTVSSLLMGLVFMYTSSINIILYSSCYISGLYINGRGVMVTL